MKLNDKLENISKLKEGRVGSQNTSPIRGPVESKLNELGDFAREMENLMTQLKKQQHLYGNDDLFKGLLEKIELLFKKYSGNGSSMDSKEIFIKQMNEFTSVNMESKVAGLIKENNEYISKLKAVIDEKSSLEVELEKLLVQLDLRRNDQQALQIENEGLRRSIKEERMKTAQEERDYRLVEDKLEKM